MTPPPRSPDHSPADASRDQVRPLAPASHRIHIENEQGVTTTSSPTDMNKKRRRKRCIKCCGCCTIFTVILAVIIIILAFTVFKVKEPKITMNSIKFEGLSYLTSTSNLQPNVNITVSADVSVKNPNVASIKLRATTISLLYADQIIGEVLMPPGNAKARRTMRMNMTIQVMVEKFLGMSRLTSDLIAGELPMGAYTRMNGRVNIFNLVKKSVGIEMNCTMVAVIATQGVRDMDCKRKVSL